MHVKYQLNPAKGLSKTVDTKTINCINLQIAIRISKNCSFQTCITQPSISRSNLKRIRLIDIVQMLTKVTSLIKSFDSIIKYKFMS